MQMLDTIRECFRIRALPLVKNHYIEIKHFQFYCFHGVIRVVISHPDGEVLQILYSSDTVDKPSYLHGAWDNDVEYAMNYIDAAIKREKLRKTRKFEALYSNENRT